MLTADQIHEAVRVLKSMGYAVTKDGRLYSLPDEEVPEVEVTSSLSTGLVPLPERGLERRRSGATNVSAPHLQSAFIDEARVSMGQPSNRDCMSLLGKQVRIIFNVDKAPIVGELTRVINHPANSPTYLIIDHEEHLLYPLNSIQSIEAVGD